MNLAATLTLNSAGFLSNMNQSIGALGRFYNLASLTSGIRGGVAGIISLGDSADELSRRLGSNVRDTVILSETFRRGGLDAGVLGEATKNLTAALAGFGANGEDAATILRSLRLSETDLLRLPLAQRYNDVIGAISKLTSYQDRLYASQALFGARAGSAMLQLDPDAINDVTRAMGSLPDVLQRNAKAFSVLDDRMRDLRTQKDLLFAMVAEQATPTIVRLTDSLLQLNASGFGSALGSSIKATVDGLASLVRIVDKVPGGANAAAASVMTFAHVKLFNIVMQFTGLQSVMERSRAKTQQQTAAIAQQTAAINSNTAARAANSAVPLTGGVAMGNLTAGQQMTPAKAMESALVRSGGRPTSAAMAMQLALAGAAAGAAPKAVAQATPGVGAAIGAAGAAGAAGAVAPAGIAGAARGALRSNVIGMIALMGADFGINLAVQHWNKKSAAEDERAGPLEEERQKWKEANRKRWSDSSMKNEMFATLDREAEAKRRDRQNKSALSGAGTPAEKINVLQGMMQALESQSASLTDRLQKARLSDVSIDVARRLADELSTVDNRMADVNDAMAEIGRQQAAAGQNRAAWDAQIAVLNAQASGNKTLLDQEERKLRVMELTRQIKEQMHVSDSEAAGMASTQADAEIAANRRNRTGDGAWRAPNVDRWQRLGLTLGGGIQSPFTGETRRMAKATEQLVTLTKETHTILKRMTGGAAYQPA
jgi:hypothetical protein